MSVKEQIEKVVDPYPVGEQHYEEVTGREMSRYSVNVSGVVLQYVIPTDEEEVPGIVEDFIENIAATVKEVTNR